ncbi:MAG: hypothetical protein P4M11_09020, partial [Candidatus Pacebacteria bacterium]|nr:hypothetical protein [Candidatus Paceibacterota bacterium]
IPCNEALVRPADVGGATLIGANITCTRGIYPAELQAIVRTLAMVPLSISLHIHTDSQASMAAIHSFHKQRNERKRMRMPARTILQLIDHLRLRREAAGGTLKLSHVSAHTSDMDIDSVGNRLADYQANCARREPGRTWPQRLRQLPLTQCEPHLHMTSSQGVTVIDDIRHSATALLQACALEKWSMKKDGTQKFAFKGTLDLGRSVLKYGDSDQQATLIHVATNTIHFALTTKADGSKELCKLICTPCDEPLSLDHLASCQEPLCANFHRQLHRKVLDLFAPYDSCEHWCRMQSRTDLYRLWLSLFPLTLSASADDVCSYPARCLIGAFTNSECSRAVSFLGFDELKKGLAVFHRLRLVCLDHIEEFYSKQKALHGSPPGS